VLAEPLQSRLAAAYGHDAPRATLHGLLLVGILALLAAASALGHLIEGTGTAIDVVFLLGGGGLVAESAWRAARLHAGEIRPSVLAPLLRPFALRLLRDVE
jgi:hypothetical protein